MPIDDRRLVVDIAAGAHEVRRDEIDPGLLRFLPKCFRVLSRIILGVIGQVFRDVRGSDHFRQTEDVRSPAGRLADVFERTFDVHVDRVRMVLRQERGSGDVYCTRHDEWFSIANR